jgi:hypothetical protein
MRKQTNKKLNLSVQKTNTPSGCITLREFSFTSRMSWENIRSTSDTTKKKTSWITMNGNRKEKQCFIEIYKVLR